MSITSVKTKPAVHHFDASGQRPGRLASAIAKILMGKNKPDYVPHIDSGDVVEVANVEKMEFSGKKMERQSVYHHTGYLGGLKTTRLKDRFEEQPARVLRDAVSKMLPKNKLRTDRLKRLIFTTP